MTTPSVLALAVLCAVSGGAQSRPAQADASAIANLPALRNPERLRAVQLLDQRAPGVAPRVRFEWDQVRGAVEYVLSGRWSTTTSWTVSAREYRVSARTATSWTSQRVAFDVSLPVGAHSWRVVAIYGPNDAGDFEHPTQLSFELR